MSRKKQTRPSGLIRFLILPLLGFLAACTPSEVTYPTLEGEQVALSDWHGKVVFINYWAEWCRPCRTEIPEFNVFAGQHRDELKVFSVNFDGVQGQALIEQVQAMAIEFDTLLADPRSALGAPSVVALPETLVIGRQGQLHKVLLGPQTLEQLDEVLLEVP